VVLSPRAVGTVQSYELPVLGDNVDLLVWQLPRDGLWLFDGRWHKRVVGSPPVCIGQVTAAGAGLALVQCSRNEGTLHPVGPLRFVLVDGRSGVTTSFSEPRPYPDVASPPVYTRLGRYWMQSELQFRPGAETVYYNWRTATFVEASKDQHGSHSYADLSTPTLWRRLCAPFRRRRNANQALRDVYDNAFQRDGAWMTAPGQTAAQQQAGDTVFGRCGHPYRNLGAVSDVQLGGGLLSWVAGNSVHVLRLRDGKQYTAAATGYDSRTASDLIFTQYAGPANPNDQNSLPTWTILAAHIPND
jgi:hypothetical protein